MAQDMVTDVAALLARGDKPGALRRAWTAVDAIMPGRPGRQHSRGLLLALTLYVAQVYPRPLVGLEAVAGVLAVADPRPGGDLDQAFGALHKDDLPRVLHEEFRRAGAGDRAQAMAEGEAALQAYMGRTVRQGR